MFAPRAMCAEPDWSAFPSGDPAINVRLTSRTPMVGIPPLIPLSKGLCFQRHRDFVGTDHNR